MMLKCDRKHEISAECGVACTCTNFLLFGLCPKTCARSGMHCFCEPGYLRSINGDCISIDMCNATSNVAKKCSKPNEIYDFCSANCQTTCEDLTDLAKSNTSEPGAIHSCSASPLCVPGCICDNGFARDFEGKCVKADKCKEFKAGTMPKFGACDFTECPKCRKCQVNELGSPVCVPTDDSSCCSADWPAAKCSQDPCKGAKCPMSKTAKCQRNPSCGLSKCSALWLDPETLAEVDCFEQCATVRCSACQHCAIRMGTPICEMDFSNTSDPMCMNANPCEPNPCGPKEKCEIKSEFCANTPCENFKCSVDDGSDHLSEGGDEKLTTPKNFSVTRPEAAQLPAKGSKKPTDFPKPPKKSTTFEPTEVDEDKA
jgi:hypothetical protein